jgi:hypothetical protein
LGFGIGADWVVAELGEVQFLLFFDHASQHDALFPQSIEHEDNVVDVPAIEDKDSLLIEFLNHFIDWNRVVHDFVTDLLFLEVE